MNDLKLDKFLIKTNSYMIDLAKVDFCNGIEELRTVLQTWAKLNGKRVDIKDEDIIEEW